MELTINNVAQRSWHKRKTTGSPKPSNFNNTLEKTSWLIKVKAWLLKLIELKFSVLGSIQREKNQRALRKTLELRERLLSQNKLTHIHVDDDDESRNQTTPPLIPAPKSNSENH